jgi:hypothetical protein
MYLSHNLPANQSPRASVVKHLRTQLRSVVSDRIDVIATHLVRDLLPEDVNGLCVCRVKRSDSKKTSMHHAFGRVDGRLAHEDYAVVAAIAAEWTAVEKAVGAATVSGIGSSAERSMVPTNHSTVKTLDPHIVAADNSHNIFHSSSESNLAQVVCSLTYVPVAANLWC